MIKAKGSPSPYLFVLAMEALSSLLKKAREGRSISGFKACRRSGDVVELSYLLFAYNAPSFCEAS